LLLLEEEEEEEEEEFCGDCVAARITERYSGSCPQREY
jgi:hypothetical protein